MRWWPPATRHGLVTIGPGKNCVYIKKPLSKGKGFAYSLDLYIDTVFIQTHYREGM